MAKRAPAHDATTLTELSDLTPDAKNANRGTERGLAMLDKSISQYGIGRSILVDKHGKVIAGNKTLERAYERGIGKMIVVPSDGTALIVHQRLDLDLETDVAAKELGIMDNRSSEVGLQWDLSMLTDLRADGAKLETFWTAKEIEALAADLGHEEAHLAGVPEGAPQFLVLVTCADEEAQSALLQKFLDDGLNVKAIMS